MWNKSSDRVLSSDRTDAVAEVMRMVHDEGVRWTKKAPERIGVVHQVFVLDQRNLAAREKVVASGQPGEKWTFELVAVVPRV